jgi:hypothetical protein
MHFNALGFFEEMCLNARMYTQKHGLACDLLNAINHNAVERGDRTTGQGALPHRGIRGV